jgi:hypothetical protein
MGRILETKVIEFALLGAEHAVGVEVKGNGAPEVAPPPGENAYSRAALGGEEVEDHTHHVIGQAADEVKARRGPCESSSTRSLLSERHLISVPLASCVCSRGARCGLDLG